MICRENHAYPPSMAEISDYIHNPLWDTFCAYLEKTTAQNQRLPSANAVGSLDGTSGSKKGAGLYVRYTREKIPLL